ncbi:MAG: M28 family peptidase [Thermoguttaceae bacterium]
MAIWLGWAPGANRAEDGRSSWTLEDIPFDGTRAFRYLEQICSLGRRPSGSEGMAAQQDLLERHFGALGTVVHRQRFEYPHPQTGQPVPMTNLIVQWAPERPERILLACHYDTLPYPMLDERDPSGEFVGANDGASGVALLMELGHEIGPILETEQKKFGVDLLFLDGEEFVFTPRGGRYFVGSDYFARQYAATSLPYAATYRKGVLLDMIGDRDLRIPQEGNGRWWPDTEALLDEIYGTAKRLGVAEFVERRGREIQDDHVVLHNVGKIPTIDLIDFDYPPWHTMGDTPDKCSALSLAKVGWVVREWLKGTQPTEGTQ